ESNAECRQSEASPRLPGTIHRMPALHSRCEREQRGQDGKTTKKKPPGGPNRAEPQSRRGHVVPPTPLSLLGGFDGLFRGSSGCDRLQGGFECALAERSRDIGLHPWVPLLSSLGLL